MGGGDVWIRQRGGGGGGLRDCGFCELMGGGGDGEESSWLFPFIHHHDALCLLYFHVF